MERESIMASRESDLVRVRTTIAIHGKSGTEAARSALPGAQDQIFSDAEDSAAWELLSETLRTVGIEKSIRGLPIERRRRPRVELLVGRIAIAHPAASTRQLAKSVRYLSSTSRGTPAAESDPRLGSRQNLRSNGSGPTPARGRGRHGLPDHRDGRAQGGPPGIVLPECRDGSFPAVRVARPALGFRSPKCGGELLWAVERDYSSSNPWLVNFKV